MTITSLRILAVALAVALAGMSATEYRTWRLASELALAELGEARLQADTQQLFNEVARERDRIRIRLRVARALLAEELDARLLAATPPEDRESVRARGLKRLDTAARIASRTLEKRPSSWQAAMILGAASHLRLLRSRDARLATQEESWLMPLALSRRIAPNHAEPTRFLAAAQLGSWSRLSPDLRFQTVEILAAAFEDADSFETLIEPWLVAAPTLEDALEIIPPHPRPWDRVRRIYAQRRDWERFVTAHGHYSSTLSKDLERRLDKAESDLKRGHKRAASAQLKNVARNLPVELSSLKILDRLLDLIGRTPQGLHPRGDYFSRWLDWYVDQCMLAACPEPMTVVSRLASASDGLQFHQTAVAALLIGDRDVAALYESRFEETTGAAWAPYQLLSARRLTDSGDLVAAGARLEAVHSSWRDSPFYVLARLSLASASRDTEAQAAWQDEMAHLEQPIRPGSDWSRLGTSWQLVFLSGANNSGLEIAIDAATPAGTPIAVLLDGEVIGWHSVARNDIIALDSEVTVGVHRLELLPLLSHSLTPGPVRLGGASPA